MNKRLTELFKLFLKRLVTLIKLLLIWTVIVIIGIIIASVFNHFFNLNKVLDLLIRTLIFLPFVAMAMKKSSKIIRNHIDG